MILQLKLGIMQNFTYLIWDEKTLESAIIDPGWEADKIIKEIKKYKLKLKYILLTHTHFDHILAIKEIKSFAGENVPVVANEKEDEKDKINFFVKDGDILNLGKKQIKIIETPGHTAGGISFLFNNQFLFTGDTLFLDGIYGRTDLKGGNKEEIKQSIKNILKLPENIIIYPGHAYSEKIKSTIKEEKRFFSNLEF